MTPRLAHLALVLALAVGAAGGACLSAWDVGGPWACSDQACPDGFTCDDGVCCVPGGSPSCPTLPAPNGSCATGTAQVWFEDRDGDGEGNARVSAVLCNAPLKGGWVLEGTDCDDADLSINSAASEACNGKDDNCDGVIDEGLANQRLYFLDSDGDGWGEDGTQLQACAAPPGRVDRGGDCAPFDPSKNPDATELCNGLDDDCDGTPDTAEPAFGDTGAAWPCLTGRPGICADGVFQCVPQGTSVTRQCVSSSAPRRERCNDVDDDCDGFVDEQPACLGPVSLVAAPGATYSAQRLTDFSTVNTACQRNTPSVAETVSADGRTWTGGTTAGQYYHVWSIEVPAAQAWDLSKSNAKLRLSFTAEMTDGTLPRGAWGDPGTSANPLDAVNPVVYLCGDTDDQVIRYVLNARANPAIDSLSGNERSFSSVLPLNTLTGDWLTGRGSGFDTSRVRRVEISIWALTPNFTITLSPTSGFFK